MTLTSELLYSRFCPNYMDMCDATTTVGLTPLTAWYNATFGVSCPIDEAPDVPESITPPGA